MLVVNFVVRTSDYLTLILSAHHIKQTLWNIFHYVGLDTFALIFWRKWCLVYSRRRIFWLRKNFQWPQAGPYEVATSNSFTGS